MSNKQYSIAFFIYVFVLVVALILSLLDIITIMQQVGIILAAFGLLQLVKKLIKNNNDEHQRNQEGS